MGLNLNFYVRKNFKIKFTETLILLNITVTAIFYLWFYYVSSVNTRRRSFKNKISDFEIRFKITETIKLISLDNFCLIKPKSLKY